MDERVRMDTKEYKWIINGLICAMDLKDDG